MKMKSEPFGPSYNTDIMSELLENQDIELVT